MKLWRYYSRYKYTKIKNTVKLTDRSVKALEITGKPQKFFDEKGLYLYVTEKGLKSWRYDYRVGGKRATVTFGRYPEVALSLAVKTRLVIYALSESFRALCMPLFESLNGRLMLQSALRNVVVVYFNVVAQRRFKLCCGSEVSD